MSDQLYHVKRTMINLKKDPTGASQEVDIKGTYTDLVAAKEAAKKCLFEEGYERDFFPTFDVKDASKEWTHGDGVMLYAVAPESEIFKVELETAPNKLDFKGAENGEVQQQLYHVLQTTIHYNIDRSGAKRDTAIEGTYDTYAQAKQCALTVLLDEDVSKESFEEYNELKDQSDWPYGENCLVHAVGQGGENYLVSVVKKP